MMAKQGTTAKILHFRRRNAVMSSEKPEKPKMRTTSLTLSEAVLGALKEDADRCHRSMAGQVQAILETIYLRTDVELHGTEKYEPSIPLAEQKRKAS